MKSEKGFSLIEATISLAILALLAVVFLGGLATTSRAGLILDEHSKAQNLARNQMEYVKSQGYIPNATEYPLAQIPDEYQGYSANITADPLYNEGGIPRDGIQKITVTIEHDDKVVATLECYKAER